MSKAVEDDAEFALIRHHIKAVKGMSKAAGAKYFSSLAQTNPEEFMLILQWMLSRTTDADLSP